MTIQKANNQFYIRLTSEQPLEKKDVISFYKFVKNSLPSGILASIEVERPGYGLDSARLIHKQNKDKKHVYEIPLTRNLVDKEYKNICYKFQRLSLEGLSLESSTPVVPNARYLPDNALKDNKDFEDFCHNLAKCQHSNWYLEKSEEGWRYGLEYSSQEKTSPLLRPWHDLPETYRKIDPKLAKQILELIEQMNYVIVPKAELEKLKKKS